MTVHTSHITLTQEEPELVAAIEASGLDHSQAQQLIEGFSAFFEEVRKYEEEARSIVVTGEYQIFEMKRARELRLKLKDIRVNAEHVRKERKEFFLRGGKAIDGMANVLKALIVPLEEHLDKQEHFAERLEEERKKKVIEERTKLLAPYVDDVALCNLDMPDEAFEIFLSGMKKAHEEKLAAEEEAEKRRIAEELSRQQEIKNLQEEAELLKIQKKIAEEAAWREKEEKEKAQLALRKKELEEQAARDLEAQKEEERAEAQRKLLKAERYRKFRAQLGWNESTNADFKEERVGDTMVVWKRVGFFNLEGR